MEGLLYNIWFHMLKQQINKELTGIKHHQSALRIQNCQKSLFKVFKVISYKEIIKYKNVMHNIKALSFFYKYWLCNLLYMIVTHNRNKMLYNKAFFFGTVFMDLLKISRIHRTHPNFNVQFIILHFCTLSDIALYTLIVNWYSILNLTNNAKRQTTERNFFFGIHVLN